jgi:PAS domain S-box-containing protein
MNPFSNPYYLIPPLIVAVVSLILLITVLRRSPRSFNRYLFCGLLASMTAWSLLIFAMRSSPNIEKALLWDKALAVIGFLTYVLYFHFTLSYTKNKRQKSILVASYLLLLVFSIIAPTHLLVEEMQMEYYGYAPVAGSFAIILSATVLLLLAAGAYNLVRRYRMTTSNEERNRILYLLFAVPFPLLGGMLDAFSNLPPATIWGNLIFCIICTVAITKYHLLDIRIVVRKGLAYLLLSIVIAVPYASILLLLNHILRTRIESWWIHAIIVLLLAILLRPLYSWAQNFVDSIFYRDRYDYLKALEQFSKEAQSIVSLEELSSTLTRLVSGALRTPRVCLLSASESDNGLIAVSSTDQVSLPDRVVLRNESPIVKWLKLKSRILSYKDLDIIPQLQSLSLRERHNLKQIEAELLVPIQTSPGQLSGILILGQKCSQQPYSSEEGQLLTALSNHMAMALENAWLYHISQQEVEERKQAQNALLISEEKYRNLLEEAPISMCNVDIKGKIIYVNRRFEECSGYSREEVVGKNGFKLDMFTPETLRYFKKGMKERLMGKPPSRLVTQFKCKDGRLIWIEIGAKLLKEHGIPVGFQIASSDITERRRAEEREKRLQKELNLSSRLASIGQLAAGVAHEINNPLTGILAFSERLLRKSIDKDVNEELEIIHNEALRASKVVDNLRTFARHHKSEKRLSSINDILLKAIELRAYELKASNIEVIADLATGLPEIMVDFQQIQQVFLNIIINAEQAMISANHGGKLNIKTSAKKEYVRIRFTDTGPGIDANDIDKIFDPFFTMKERIGGTGLGLSVCHGIVSEHSGKIYVKSSLGEGATFFVELPVVTNETTV